MATVGETSDLILVFKVVETDSTTVTWVDEVGELDNWEDLTYEDSGDRVELRDTGRCFWPRNVRFKEIRETQTAKEGAYEIPNETQKRKSVD